MQLLRGSLESSACSLLPLMRFASLSSYESATDRLDDGERMTCVTSYYSSGMVLICPICPTGYVFGVRNMDSGNTATSRSHFILSGRSTALAEAALEVNCRFRQLVNNYKGKTI